MIKFSLTNKEPKRGDKLDPITQRRYFINEQEELSSETLRQLAYLLQRERELPL